jgi:hypothetical protein
MQDEKPNEQKRQYAKPHEYINDGTQDNTQNRTSI